jgi:hypothetical protein
MSGFEKDGFIYLYIFIYKSLSLSLALSISLSLSLSIYIYIYIKIHIPLMCHECCENGSTFWASLGPSWIQHRPSMGPQGPWGPIQLRSAHPATDLNWLLVWTYGEHYVWLVGLSLTKFALLCHEFTCVCTPSYRLGCKFGPFQDASS